MSTTNKSRTRAFKTTRASAAIHEGSWVLGRYTDPRGKERELIRRRAAGGSSLVIDRRVGTLTDERLVVHLEADEPAENARIVASLYLADPRGQRCRRLLPEDLRTIPFAPERGPVADPAERLVESGGGELVDQRGSVYRLQAGCSDGSLPELRWWRHAPNGRRVPPEAVTVREVIGALESYQPVKRVTVEALCAHHCDSRVSTAVLRAELARITVSPIVLNRGLREAVLAAMTDGGLSMSEIAIRCGRSKRDTRGCESGETSWLARRIGILPEGGKNTPTPWVSSDVLALIARDGLGISPREVELG